MARNLTSGGSCYITATTASTPSFPLTIVAWCKPGATMTAFMPLVGLGSSSKYQAILLRGDSTKQIQAASFNGSTFSASGGNNFINSVWQHYAAVFASATSRQAFLNGVQDTLNSTSNDPGNLTLAGVNSDGGHDPSGAGNGLVAEAAIWTAALKQNEITALAKGVNVRFVRPGALLLYWPLWGLASPEPDMSGNAYEGTLNNMPAFATHAPVTLWTRRPAIMPQAAAAASAVVFRRTLSPIGTRVGSRQIHAG